MGRLQGYWSRRGAVGEALADRLLRQFAANENDAAFAALVLAPGPLMIAVENHVDALEHEPVGIVLEREDPFGAKNLRPVLSDQSLYPGEETFGIERCVGPERQR